MTGYREVWRTERGPPRVLFIAIAVAVFQLAAVGLFGITELPAVLVIPLAILAGPAGIWGAAIGALTFELAAVGIGFVPIARFLDVLVCGALAWALWVRLPADLRDRPLRGAIAAVPIALVAVLIGAGAGTVAFVVAGFDALAVLPGLVLVRIPLAVLLAPLLVGAGHRYRVPVDTASARTTGRWIGTVVVLGAFGVAWLAGTVVFGLVHRDRLAFDFIEDALARELPAPLDAMALLMTGPHGWIVYVIGAIIAVGVIVLLLRYGGLDGHNRPTGR